MRIVYLIMITTIVVFNVNGQVQEIYETSDNILAVFNKKSKTEYSVIKEIYPGFYKFSPKTDINNTGALAKYGIIDKHNTVLVEPKYEMVTSYLKSGIIELYSANTKKSLLYSLKTKSILYDNVRSVSNIQSFIKNKYIIFELNNLFGAFDFNGHLIYAPVYKKILVTKDIIYLLKNKTLTNSKNTTKLTKIHNFELDKSGILVYKKNKKRYLYDFNLSSIK